MTKKLQCKACGYIISKDKLGDVCPACGVSSKAFEDYTPKVSEDRLKKLEIHLHPVVVHFAQAFGPLIILLGCCLFFFDSVFGISLYNTMRIIAIFYPLAVFSAIPSGVFDGKLRFKKITPILKTKLIIANIFLILTIIISVMALQAPVYPYNIDNNTTQFWVIFILSFATFGCEALLGKIGGSLMCAKIA
jgi:rubredoxin/uncharacterized membrane protein